MLYPAHLSYYNSLPPAEFHVGLGSTSPAHPLQPLKCVHIYWTTRTMLRFYLSIRHTKCTTKSP